ncbi:MAG: hypothetical protein R3F59_38565 [Myxococcota bacterium]
MGTARAAAEAEHDRAAAEQQREGAERRAALEQAVAEGTRGRDAARKRHAHAEEQHLRLTRSRSAAEAERAEIRRQLQATAGAGDLVRKVVPGAPALAELAPDAAARADWVARLGDRAGQPVVRTLAELQAVAAARPADATVSVVLWPEGAPPPAAAIALAADLAEAVAAGAQRPGPASGSIRAGSSPWGPRARWSAPSRRTGRSTSAWLSSSSRSPRPGPSAPSRGRGWPRPSRR